MAFLYMLEKIRMPGLNELMLLLTRLGEETAFLVAALIALMLAMALGLLLYVELYPFL